MPKSPKLKMLPPKNRRVIIGIFGFCLAVCGLLHGIFWEGIFNRMLQQELVLKPNSKMFDAWKTPPLEMTLDTYLYNWTNSEHFQNESIKPILEQLGPYRFIEKPNKVDIVWHPENASITYRKRSEFFFDAAASNGSLSDKIITFNTLAVAVSNKAKRWSAMRRSLIDLALKVYPDGLVLKKSVDELLFKGYDDVLLDLASVIPSSLTDIVVPFDKFGYCYGRNSSSEFSGVFNIHTGADDMRKLGQLNTWNFKNSTKFFPQQCAQIHGSPGELQPPGLEKNGIIEIYVPDFCRMISLEYVDIVEVEGVIGYKYRGGLRAVDNGTLYPENKCHCNGECLPSGVMNTSSCWYDASIFMSYPHFYNADPIYVAQLEGMNPQEDRHEFYIVLEPKTGLILDIAARFQSNVFVAPMSDLSMFRNTRRIVFPLFWFEAKTRITPELAADMKMVPLVIVGGQIFGGICFAIGLILFFWHPLVQQMQRRLQKQLVMHEAEKDDHIKTAKILTVSPDISPLLVRAKPIRILPHQLSMESQHTVLTTISPSPSDTNLSCSSLSTG